MKKILLVTYGFYPLNSPRAFRATELAKELAREGHQVTVYISGQISEMHRAFEKKTGITMRSLGPLTYKPIVSTSFWGRILSRTLSLFIEYPDIELFFKMPKALKQEAGYDLLVSIAVPFPNHWGVAYVLKKNPQLCKTWVADCGDPYMGCRTDTFKKLFYFKYVEKWWCRKADYITIPTQEAMEGYYPEFRSKLCVIPQGFNMTEIPIPDYIPNSIPTFAYAGNLQLKYRNPLPLLEFLSTIPIDFKFILYNEQDFLKPYVEPLKGKLELRKYIPRADLLPILGKMDFLINFENGTSVQTPSKLIDYAIAKRPVLSIGTTLDSQTVLEFLQGNYSMQLKIEDIDQYDIKNVAAKFLELIR
jgi:hypothetical protein